MDPLLLIPIVAAVEVPVVLAVRALRRVKPTPAESTPDNSGEVWRILMGAYTKMRRGGVSVRSPWITACIAEIEKGGDCPPDVAILAIRKTRAELPAGRYQTGYLDEAESELAAL